MDIADEINLMASKDQEFGRQLIHNETDELWVKINKVIAENTVKMKRIIEESGLPTISKVREKASNNAWLIVQHFSDMGFKKRYLKLLKENINDVNKQNIAYLEDRILMNESKLQIYGTQIVYDERRKKHVAYKLNDFEGLNERRKTMDLESFEEYLESFRGMYRD